MPLTSSQKLVALAPCFAGARKHLDEYVRISSVDTLHATYVAIGAPRLTRLAASFFPDQLKSLQRDLTTVELTHLGSMGVPTLQSFTSMTPQWVQTMVRTITAPGPTHTITLAAGGAAGLPGLVLNRNGVLDQTALQPVLGNHVVIELDAHGAAVRNLIFSASRYCVGEVNFANHGFGAVSGHAHVYPIIRVPLTGHHEMGTPHIDMADYPQSWRQLPAGINPRTPLGQ